MARLQKLKLPKGVEIDEVSNDNLFTHPSAGSVPTTLAVKDYLRDEINKHDQAFWPDDLYRNAIINGNFDIWQRGTSFNIQSKGSSYTADRWYAYRVTSVNYGALVERSTDVPNTTSTYSIKTTCTGFPGGTYDYSALRLYYNIEDRSKLYGKPVTVSFWIKRIGNPLSMLFYFKSGVGSDSRVINREVDGWQHYSFTKDPFEDDSLGFFWNVQVNTVGDGYLLSQVQLNLGDKPLPFSPRPYAEELALCQRYYENSFNAGTPPANGSAAISLRINSLALTSGELRPEMTPFKVRKRVTPTMTYYGNLNSNWEYYNDSNAWVAGTSMSTFVNEIGVAPIVFGNEGITPGKPYLIRGGWAADAEL